MDNGFKTRVVHESEAQRQHPRIRIPATLTLPEGSAETRLRVLDLSAGGFSFEASGRAFRVGRSHEGTIHFAVDPAGLSVPVRFQIRNADAGSGRIGCAFEDLTPAQVSLLRYLITSYLGGEIVAVGDVLAAVSRDSYLRPRAAPKDITQPVAQRARVAFVTGFVFVLGVAAFVYALAKLYGVLFITHANAAKVAAASFTVSMPRDGTFFSLVPEDGLVKKGQPIGSFQAAMLDVVQNDPGALKLTPAQLSELMGETLKGTITSPCDCKVHVRYASDSQFINRNQPLFELAATDAKAYVLARFPFERIAEIEPGHGVSFRISGESGLRSGTVRELRMVPTPLAAAEAGGSSDLRGLSGGGATSDVLVQIEPAQPIDNALLDRPVDVQLGGLGGLAARFGFSWPL